jgi:hypothetical protein
MRMVGRFGRRTWLTRSCLRSQVLQTSFGRRRRHSMLARAVSKRDTFVLDNREHLIVDVAQIVANALGSASRLRVLATSREAPKVPGERVPPRCSSFAARGIFLGRGSWLWCAATPRTACRRLTGDSCCEKRLLGQSICAVATELRCDRDAGGGCLCHDEVRRRLDERFGLSDTPAAPFGTPDLIGHGSGAVTTSSKRCCDAYRCLLEASAGRGAAGCRCG